MPDGIICDHCAASGVAPVAPPHGKDAWLSSPVGLGRAVGGWFVPVVNLWFPRRIALDVWDASSPWDAPRSHALVNGWWAAWVISLLAGRYASFTYRGAETAPEIQKAVGQVLFADAVDVLAAVLAILFVIVLTRMQDAKARTGPGAPAPVSG